MRKLVLILLVISFCSCNRFWNVVIDGEANREVFKDGNRKTVVITYPLDSTSKIRVKENTFGQ